MDTPSCARRLSGGGTRSSTTWAPSRMISSVEGCTVSRRSVSVSPCCAHAVRACARGCPGAALWDPGSTFRSLVLRPALSLVSVDTAGSSDHQARDAGALASGWVSQLLTMQISEWGRASADLRALIEQMSVENPLWGAPRIHGEL